jgi:hypothetical protein
MHLSAAVLALVAAQASPAPQETVLFDYESPNQAFESADRMEYVSEHVTQGKRAGKVRLDRPFAPNIFFFGGTNQVGKWGEYDRFVIDVFVEGGPVTAAGFITDKEGRDWWKRHNYEYRLRPGAGTLSFSLGALARSNGQGNLDLASVSMVALQFSGDNPASPPTLYLDNARLVKGAREVPVAGLRKFAFGPARTATMPGFTRVTSATAYQAAAGFGWLPGGQFGRDFDMDEMLGRHRPPDDLGRHFSMPLRAVFAVDLPDGRYGAWLLLGPPGNGWGPSFRRRTVTANGTVVVDQSFDLRSFRAHEFLFQDEEDLPGDDLWEKYIRRLFVPQRFEAVVAGGQLKLDFNAYGSPWCAMVNGLAVWPKSSDPDAERWLAALDASRREQFNLYHVEKLPPAPPAYPATESDRARGFVTFVHAPDREVAVNAVPTAAEAGRTSVESAGAPGETVHVCLGVLPLRDSGALTASTLRLRNASTPAASEIAGRVRVVRYKALNRTATYEIAPKYLDGVEVLPVSLRAGVTRSFWGTIAIPSDAAAGDYAGEWILSGGSTRIVMPVRLRVWPIRLAEVPIPMGMFVMSPSDSSLAFEPGGEAYWAAWKELLEDARKHGLTSVDPAIHIPLLRIAGGRAEIDFREADRFMELARAAGFTQELSGYAIDTGLGIRVHPGFDPAAEARRWGTATYADAVRAYFDAIRVHSREKNWLPIAFCTDDEYLIHPGGDPATLAAQHRLLREAAPGFHFVAFDSAILGGPDASAKEAMLADLDTWAPGLHGPKDAERIHAAGRRLWLYNTGLNRFTFGSYLFYAREKYGVQGLFQWIYNGGGTYGDFYLASHNESHYGVTYPSTRGLRSTPTWERILLGMNDHRYLETARRAIEEGKGRPAAAALEKTLESLFSRLRFGKPDADAIAGDGKAENPMSPESMEAFRRSLAEGILSVRGGAK